MEANAVIQHISGSTFGGVDHKVTHSTTGIALETDAACPRKEGESESELVKRSASLACEAYLTMVEELRAAGVEVGPFKKPGA